MSGLSNRHLFLTVLEVGSLRSRHQQIGYLWEDTFFFGLQIWHVCSFHLHEVGEEGGRERESWSSFKGTNPLIYLGLPWWLRGRPRFISGSGRSPGERNSNPLQYSWWRIPWMEEPGRLQSTGSQRVRQDWATLVHFFFI